MNAYKGEDMDTVTLNLEEGEIEHVLVTRDESTFYSNDNKQVLWLEYGESVLRKKGPGGSIMVSDFLCACHGPMKLDPKTAKEKKICQPKQGYCLRQVQTKKDDGPVNIWLPNSKKERYQCSRICILMLNVS